MKVDIVVVCLCDHEGVSSQIQNFRRIFWSVTWSFKNNESNSIEVTVPYWANTYHVLVSALTMTELNCNVHLSAKMDRHWKWRIVYQNIHQKDQQFCYRRVAYVNAQLADNLEIFVLQNDGQRNLSWSRLIYVAEMSAYHIYETSCFWKEIS